MFTYAEAKAKVDRSRYGQPRVGNNTYLREIGNYNGNPDYAVRLHATDVRLRQWQGFARPCRCS